MPLINVQPMTMQNGDKVTTYTNTVGPAQETFTFSTAQETVILRNRGSKNITYNLGGQSGTLGRSETVKVTGSITTFDLTSEQGTQAFEIWADEAGSVGVGEAGVTALNTKVTELATSLGETNSQLAQSAKQVDLTQSVYNDTPHIPAGINEKVVYKVSDLKYQVISRKTNTSGYTMMEFEKSVGAAADSLNYGGTKDLLRLTGVKGVSDVVTLFTPTIKATSQLSGTDDFVPLALGVGQYDFYNVKPALSNNNSNRLNSWVTFDVEITKKHLGYLDLAFIATTGTSQTVEVYINNELKTTLNTKSDSLKTLFFSIPVNTLGTVEVKIQAVGVTPFRTHFLGVNVQKLNNHNRDFASNGLMYITESSHYISQSRGANDYAFLEKESGKWAGSYHGGETLNELMMKLDGVEISTMENAGFRIGKNLKIIQNTTIISKVNVQSIVEITNDSTYIFNAGFDVLSPFTVSSFYVGMTCSNDTFYEVLYPSRKTLSTSLKKVALPPAKKVVQLEPTTGRTITSIFSAVDGYVGGEPLAVSFTSGIYSKVYHGLAVLSDKTLNNIMFGSIKIFD